MAAPMSTTTPMVTARAAGADRPRATSEPNSGVARAAMNRPRPSGASTGENQPDEKQRDADQHGRDQHREQVGSALHPFRHERGTCEGADLSLRIVHHSLLIIAGR